MSITLIKISSILPPKPHGDDMAVTHFSRDKVFDLFRTTKILIGIGHDNLSSTVLRHGNFALTDAYTSLINKSSS